MADHTEDRDALAAVIRDYWPESGGQTAQVAASAAQTACADALLASGWFAARVAAAKAEAWDEGYDAGHQDARAVQSTYPDPTDNPYRADRHAGEQP